MRKAIALILVIVVCVCALPIIFVPLLQKGGMTVVSTGRVVGGLVGVILGSIALYNRILGNKAPDKEEKAEEQTTKPAT